MRKILDGAASFCAALLTLAVCGVPAWYTFSAVQAGLAPVWVYGFVAALAVIGLILGFAFLRKGFDGISPHANGADKEITAVSGELMMHLSEFNFGTLAYPFGDPRIAGFEDAIDQVNDIGARSPGFVWRIPDEEMDSAQSDPLGVLTERPNTASTLSVWENPASLYHFVTRTLHARIMKGAPDWFVPGDSGHLVCWWVPEGSRPTVAEGMQRWRDLQQHGDTEMTFGAKQLKALALGDLAPTQ